MNVVVWSDGCAAQFLLRYVFEALINLSWFYDEQHHGTGPVDGIGTLKKAAYRDVKSGKAIINDAKEFAEYADKTIKGISSLYMSSDDPIHGQSYLSPSLLECKHMIQQVIDGYFCISCRNRYSKTDTFDWLKCAVCKQWFHENCF